MLSTIGESGGFCELKTIPFGRNFDRWISMFPPGAYGKVCSHLQARLKGETKFAIGSLVPKEWNTPLIYVYDIAEDEPTAAFLLGLMVLKIMIEADDEWLCTQTTLSGSALDTNFYWRKS